MATDAQPSDALKTTPSVLDVRDLHKSFGGKPVLRGIHLTIHKGELLVLLGANGCGKSTLLRCLNLLETYERGEVWMDGTCVNRGAPPDKHPSREERRKQEELRRRVGMVFQGFNLFPHMTVLGNVMCGPRRVLNMDEARAQTLALNLLSKVGLHEKADWDPGALSGGQKQRVAIARALAMAPEVMLFDEATSALDPIMTKDVGRVIRGLAADGMTMLLVSHDLDFAREMADRILFMEDGVITVDGPPEEVFVRPPTEAMRRFLESS